VVLIPYRRGLWSLTKTDGKRSLRGLAHYTLDLFPSSHNQVSHIPIFLIASSFNWWASPSHYLVLDYWQRFSISYRHTWDSWNTDHQR